MDVIEAKLKSRHSLNSIDKFQVSLQILSLESWCMLPEIVIGEVCLTSIFAAQESTAKWRVSDDSNAKFATCVQQTICFDVRSEWGELERVFD
jgi:hypothetical protein